MAAWAAGTVVDGRYTILSRIGSGGMADVWLAEDAQLGRRIALKLLYPRFASDSEFVERFRREASSAASLQHPNVVSVFDRGEWEGHSYIAMEYLEGRSLKQLIVDEGPLAPARAIEIAVQILKAARFAHRRGIIHRDLKPHNVIVDDEGRAKVTDFGIARAGASDMTATGSIMGTAQYLSPEQAQGHAVSAESDLYAVGIVLYEMLTGRVPFDGETAVAVALKQVAEAPVAPSAVHAGIPHELDEIVLRALEKDPARRFADADEMIGALEGVRGRLLAGVPVGQATSSFAAAAGPATDPTMLAGAAAPPLVDDPRDELGPLPEEDPRRGRRWPWILLAAVVAAVALGALLLSSGSDTVAVPDVGGRTFDAARAQLERAGLRVERDDVPDDARRGRVVSTDPAAGDRVDEGSTVTVRVSRGPRPVAVPRLAGRSEAEAGRILAENGLLPRTRREPSSEVDEGDVIRTDPKAGDRVRAGSRVTLFVSSGPNLVSVPDVRGASRASATAQLEQAGLRVSASEQESDETAGTVIRQGRAAGSRVAPGTVVGIVVAKAPPEPVDREVSVPGVSDLSEATARSALERRGLSVTVRRRDVLDPAQDGKVIEQTPRAGSSVPPGSAVTIVVGRGSGSDAGQGDETSTPPGAVTPPGTGTR